VPYQDISLLIEELDHARLGGRPPDLVRVPLIGARALAEAGHVATIDEAAARAGVSTRELAGLRAAYEPDALAACEYTTVTGRALYYLPGELEVRVMVYRPSRVREAVRDWPQHRGEIEVELRELGFRGLPEGYDLEDDPWKWDLYDVLVAGYVWAHDGTGVGRIARRSLRVRYFGAVAELLDLAASLGASAEDLSQPSTAMVDALEWEVARRALGIFHRSVFNAERGLSGASIVEAMGRGEVYLALLSPRDALLVNGSPELGIQTRVPPGDLDAAPPPEGVSLRLNANDQPVRRGSRRGLIEGWLWGFPRGAAEGKAAWRLLQKIHSPQVQEAESAAFLVPPVLRGCCSGTRTGFARRVADAVHVHLAGSSGLYVPRFADFRKFETYRDRLYGVWNAQVLHPLARGDGYARIDRARLREALAKAFE
jgi:hypothetical protein